MPKLNTRTNRDGSVTPFVRFRLDGVQTSLTFATVDEAEQFVRDVDQRGAQWAWDTYQNEEVVAEMTLDDWATRHFASLGEARPGSPTRGRGSTTSRTPTSHCSSRPASASPSSRRASVTRDSRPRSTPTAASCPTCRSRPRTLRPGHSVRRAAS